jgi:Putative stress-induced transcription regulator
MKPLDSESGREGWLLADPQLAVDFVDTRRSQGDALAGELPVDDEAARWVREHVRSQDLGRPADLVNLRSVLREVFTAIVDATALPARALDTINRLAEQAPVTLTAYVRQGDISVERTSRADSAGLLHASNGARQAAGTVPAWPVTTADTIRDDGPRRGTTDDLRCSGITYPSCHR